MIQVQAAFEDVIQPVPDRARPGCEVTPVSTEANAGRACETVSVEASQSLLSRPPPSTQRRSLFRR